MGRMGKVLPAIVLVLALIVDAHAGWEKIGTYDNPMKPGLFCSPGYYQTSKFVYDTCDLSVKYLISIPLYFVATGTANIGFDQCGKPSSGPFCSYAIFTWASPCQNDHDGDGYFTEGGSCGPIDCNDSDSSIHPGASEPCDNKDNDCDGQTDEGCCPHITSFTGDSAILDPATGGSFTFTYSVDQSYDEATITIDGEDIGGTSWNGLLGGKLAEPGTYTAVLTVKKGDCTVTASTNVRVETYEGCKLRITVGSSANVASGELTDSLPLFSTQGAGPSLALSLHYGSLDGYDGPLGRGWSHSFEVFVTENAFGEVVLHEGDGGRKLYTPSGSGYLSQPGDTSILTGNADGTFTLTRKDGARYAFRADGEIASITDRNGNALTFAYAGGLLQTVTDPAGRVVTFSYDASGKLASVTDPAGNFYSFTLGGSLTNVIFPDGGTWSYAYDADAFLTAKNDPNGALTTYRYDDRHRVVSSTDPEGRERQISYPENNQAVRTTTFTEKDGGVWQYTYDTASGDLLAKTDPEGNTVSYTYDANHNTLSRTDADGSFTRYTYDAADNMTSVTDPLGQTTAYTYNAFGQATSITDTEGNLTRYEFDEKGNLTKTTDPTGAATSYTYDVKGNIISVTDPAGRITTMTYDAAGNVTSTTNPAGAVTAFVYDAAGNLTSQTEANGATSLFVYDERNRLVKATDPAGNVISYTYDARGNRISQTDANGTTWFEYNAQDQLIKVTDPADNVTTYAYGSSGCASCGGGTDKLTAVFDANGNTVRFDYDALGRKVKVIDALGNAVTFSYDLRGNILTRTDANGRTTTFAYDALGRVKEQVDPLGGKVQFAYNTGGRLTQVTDPIRVVTSYEYNAAGRLSRTDSPDAGTTVYTYNPDGTLKTKTDANGVTATYSYDAAGRLIEVRFPDASEYVTYTYDTCSNGKGRLCSMTDASGATAYNYDTLGRIVAEQKTILGVTYTTGYEYDKTGQLKAATYPSGRRVAYTYDKLKRPTNVTARLNQPAPLVQGLVYDKVGNQLSSTFGNGLTQRWTYDPANRVKTISAPGGLGHTYTYDPAGNITAIADGLNPSDSRSYRYDELDRLSTAVGPWGTLAWTYDANGNRLSQQNGVKYTYTYDGNRLESVANGHIDYYRYDDAGNTTSDGKHDFVYNQNNRLIEALEAGRTLGEYVYNGKGQRVVKQTGPAAPSSASGQTVVYHYGLAGNLIEETTGNGKLLVDYVYLGNQPLAMIRKQGNGEETFYYHNDHLGMPKVMTDKLGKIVWNIEFGPFGNEVEQKGRKGGYIRSVENNLRFPGQYFDAETGLHQNGFRDYNPVIGRYGEADLIGLAGGINLFAYTFSNPVSFIDPSGLEIAVAIGMPQGNNLFGHVAAAVSGGGVYSSGTKEAFGSSFTTYIQNQSAYRDSIVFIFPTNSEQDEAFIKAFMEAVKLGHSAYKNNCADITGEGLKAADLINDSAMLKFPSMLLDYMILRANEGKVSTILTISKGNQEWQALNNILSQFDP